MNERIKELSRLAQTVANENCADEFGSVDERKRRNSFEEKFAELIVRECASIDFYKLAHIGTEDDYNVTQVIKQHFGVEE